ncbi:MAG: hypothetical protein ACXVEV_09825 [Nocardioidaceae bacterium]
MLIGAKLFALLGHETSWVLAVVFVPAVAVVFGFLADRLEYRVLVWATAFAGAALELSGLGAFTNSDLTAFRHPSSGAQTVLVAVTWVVLSFVGRTVQLRLRARRT